LSVKRNSEAQVDLPGQEFFSFIESSAPKAPARIVPKSAVPTEIPAELLRAAPETKELRGSFVTEARASELFIELAAVMRPGQVALARIAFKPFRSTLYSFKITRNKTAQVKFHQAFRQASEAVLQQAMQLMLARRKSERKFMDREAYDEFVRALPLSDFALPGARKPRRVAVVGPGSTGRLTAASNA